MIVSWRPVMPGGGSCTEYSVKPGKVGLLTRLTKLMLSFVLFV